MAEQLKGRREVSLGAVTGSKFPTSAMRMVHI